MNEQQLQQILTIQQAIAAAATAAVINSLLNPQQQQQQQQLGNGGASSPASQIDSNNRTAQELLLHLQQQAVAANLAQQQQQQQQQQQHHQHHNNEADQQQDRPDSRLDSPAGTSSPANNQQVDINNQTIQNLLVQLQQQAAGANPLSAISNASALAALNLNLNNQLPSQMPNMGGGGSGGSPINRSSSMVQNDPFLSASPTTSGNMQQQANNQMPSNKKLKRYHQPQPNQLNRSSHDATSKPHSSPKNHSTISNLAQRNNSSSTTNSSSSSSAAAAAAFLPNNVGLPRKLVRGQDVWLGRGAEQTRQILKCMWCGQSFRTLAEMTQHMKVTQHYTNIISQEQITSWKQPESSETNTGKQSSRQSNQAKMLDESLDTSSEKFNESDRDDSFSNDDEPPEKTRVPKSRQSSASKVTNNSKAKRDSSGENREATEQSLASLKSAAKNRKRARNEDRDTIAESPMQDDSDAENSSASAASSHRKSLNNSGDALKGNDEDNKPESSAASPDEKIKHESGVGERSSHPIQSDDGRRDDNSAAPSPDLSLKPKLKPNGDSVKSPASVKEADDNDDDGADDYDDDDQHSELDEQVGRVNAIAENDNDEDEAEDREKMNTLEDVREHNNDDCDKITRKRSKDKGIDMDVIKQVAEVQKGDGTGDPLSALETMVEKSFDPRMRPGMASGGILQRLGIDEEVCPPWQHINYANWYAAAAYGHPMAAALLAAGMNLQNGIKLSKNMDQKKGDD